MPGLLRVESERRGDAVRLALGGELDIAAISAVRREVTGALSPPSARRLLIDLRGLSFMDSSGIKLLLELAGGSESGGYELVVVKGPPDVHRVLEITHAEEQLPLVDTPEDIGFVTT